MGNLRIRMHTQVPWMLEAIIPQACLMCVTPWVMLAMAAAKERIIWQPFGFAV